MRTPTPPFSPSRKEEHLSHLGRLPRTYNIPQGEPRRGRSCGGLEIGGQGGGSVADVGGKGSEGIDDGEWIQNVDRMLGTVWAM